MSRKVLIITYYWPPSGGVGVQRWMHYALELKKAGWEPIIYTPSNPQFSIRDEKQLDRVKDLPTYKTRIWEPFDLFHRLTGNKERSNIKQGLVLEKSRKGLKDWLVVWVRGNLFVPDPRKYWVKPSVRFLKKLIREEGIGHVITTGPPHSMHLIGYQLKRKLSIQWFADFRDPWYSWDVLPKLKANFLTMYRHKRMEKKVLQVADEVLTVSQRLLNDFNSRVPQASLRLLYNGVTIDQTAKSKPDGEKFVIGYFGMLNELREPKEFWQVLEDTCENNEAFRNRLILRLGGIISDSIIQHLRALPHISQCLEVMDYVPHEELFAQYAKCNLLLLLLNRSDNAKWILPVKFFEYLTVKRPILALGPEASDLGDIMKGQKIGQMTTFENKEEMENVLTSVFQNSYAYSDSDANSLLKRFSHKELSSQLIKWLE